MWEQRSDRVRAKGAVVTRNAGGDSRLVLDDVHSFVLRVSLNRSRSGEGRVRPQFQLEYVNGSSSHRFKSLEEVLEQIRRQVAEIFEGIGAVEP